MIKMMKGSQLSQRSKQRQCWQQQQRLRHWQRWRQRWQHCYWWQQWVHMMSCTAAKAVLQLELWLGIAKRKKKRTRKVSLEIWNIGSLWRWLCWYLTWAAKKSIKFTTNRMDVLALDMRMSWSWMGLTNEPQTIHIFYRIKWTQSQTFQFPALSRNPKRNRGLSAR